MRAGALHPSGATPLTGRYLVKNRALLALLTGADALLGLTRAGAGGPIPGAPRRVLLAVGGHLGDAVIATAAIEQLRSALPDTDIGILLPSWSRPVLEDDDRIRWIHLLDHWKASRSGASPWTRWRRYRASRRTALREIRALGYDVAVDLYGYFPNMSTVLHRAAIRTRIGFSSGGLGPLYTHAVDWSDDRRHVAERQVELVRLLTPDRSPRRQLRYSLPMPSGDVVHRVAALLDAEQLASRDYVVVHMGVGAERRQWQFDKWLEVLSALAADGHRLVFTGRGASEREAIAAAVRRLPAATNLCDRLEWSDFVQVIREARMVLTVETAAAHVAAATETPCVAIWSGTTSPDHWGPLGASVSLLTQSVPCAPCFLSRGCAAMSCLRDLAATDVLAAARRMLPTTSYRDAPSLATSTGQVTQ